MITLASDFGSPYPAAMRGVIARRCDARLLDVSHDLPRGDVRAGAFWLRFTLPEFPPAVHCAVVDPGVGTDRAAIVVRAGDHAIVAPDNGLAIPAAQTLTRTEEEPIEVFEIHVENPASATFHGRDVFAPAAADVHEAGVANLETIDRLEPIDEFVDLALPEPTVDRNAKGRPVSILGEVLVIDTFGNVITNVPGELLADVDSEAIDTGTVDGDTVDADTADADTVDADTVDADTVDGPTVEVNGEPVPVRKTFGGVGRGEKVVTVGSHGYVECDVNDGRGDERFGLSPRSTVQFSF